MVCWSDNLHLEQRTSQRRAKEKRYVIWWRGFAYWTSLSTHQSSLQAIPLIELAVKELIPVRLRCQPIWNPARGCTHPPSLPKSKGGDWRTHREIMHLRVFEQGNSQLISLRNPTLGHDFATRRDPSNPICGVLTLRTRFIGKIFAPVA